MNQKRVYKRYPKEFKEEAVALVTEQGYSDAEAAKSLGVRANQFYGWKARIEDSKRDGALSDDERAEQKRLRKENKTLRIEKEIYICLLRQRNEVTHHFVKHHVNELSVARLCQMVNVSRSGCYSWMKRPGKLISADELKLCRHSKALFARSRQSLGSRELEAQPHYNEPRKEPR